MIPVLRSIDTLFNRFDELSKCHTNLLANFNQKFSDIDNPLRDVARPEDEQRKTAANILLVVDENDVQIESIKTLEDFHRRVIKNRHLHRPPNYSSNDSSLQHHFLSKSSSIMTETTSKIIMKTNTPRPVVTTVKNTFIEPKAKITPQSSPFTKTYQRSTVKTFTMETVNRLSRPKHQLPGQRTTKKPVQRRPRSYENVRKEASVLPPIKRTKPIIVKPSPKKLKVENRAPTQTLKRTPFNSPSRPLIFVAPIPTIQLSFPSQPHQQSSRIVISPTTTVINKRSASYHRP